MKIRTIASGSDVMAFVREGVDPAYTYRPIAGQTACALTVEDTDRESTAKNLGGTVDYFKGLNRYGLTVEVDAVDPADVDPAEVSHEELFDWELALEKKDILISYVTHSSTEGEEAVPDTSKPSYMGRFVIKAPFSSAGSGENVTSSVTCKGCQIPLTKVAVVF